jgi:uncharacterized protein YecE (DUF72 family)
MADARQRTLFDDGFEPEPAPRRGRTAPVLPAAPDAEVAALAARLPEGIRLGTSSWSFPGWSGLVYAPREGRPESEQRLAREGLAAYAACPLFRTVSLDRTFYAPLDAAGFARYAAAVPEDFRFVVKAPAAITDPFTRAGASGRVAGDNPSFLDAAAAAVACLAPAAAGLGTRLGAVVFQFPPLGRALLADVPRTVARLVAFVAALGHAARDSGPRPVPVALEVRDPELLGAGLAAGLRDTGALPCLAAHARMPAVEAQAHAWGVGSDPAAGPLVVRWNLHAGKDYEGARADYFPFDRLVDEDLPTRRALARLARGAAAAGRTVLVTINNKAEGSAPWSVRRLAEAIVADTG